VCTSRSDIATLPAGLASPIWRMQYRVIFNCKSFCINVKLKILCVIALYSKELMILCSLLLPRMTYFKFSYQQIWLHTSSNKSLSLGLAKFPAQWKFCSPWNNRPVMTNNPTVIIHYSKRAGMITLMEILWFYLVSLSQFHGTYETMVFLILFWNQQAFFKKYWYPTVFLFNITNKTH